MDEKDKIMVVKNLEATLDNFDSTKREIDDKIDLLREKVSTLRYRILYGKT